MSGGEITCLEHLKPVELRKAICHANGTYCNSPGFTVVRLDRGQAMALLLLAKGLEAQKASREQ